MLPTNKDFASLADSRGRLSSWDIKPLLGAAYWGNQEDGHIPSASTSHKSISCMILPNILQHKQHDSLNIYVRVAQVAFLCYIFNGRDQE
jgi:hypothetical protein